MTPAATLGAYALALALVFGAALGVGNAVGPVGAVAQSPHTGTAHEDPASGTDPASAGHGASSADQPAERAAVPGGLAVASDGYALELDRTTMQTGTSALSFTVRGPDGEPLTDYTPTHEKELHLIVVRRDLTGYQHLHPERDDAGVWSLPVSLAEPGPYKVFADFTPAGREDGLTLAADLAVPGEYAPRPLPAPSASASVDGYDVELDGRLVAGTSSPVTLSVSRGAEPVTDLQPHLGAYGHLVALRAGDLAYLHVHPDGGIGEPGTTAGPDVTFTVDVPSPAVYRLFLDFAHAGAVHTAELTAPAAPAGAAPADAHAH